MQVGAELTVLRFALHGRDDFFADHKTADVAAIRFLDKFLYQEFGAYFTKGFNHTFRRLLGFREDNPPALGAFTKLKDQWCSTNKFDQLLGVVNVIRKTRLRQADAFTRKQLQRAQFIARTPQGDR